MKTAFIFVLFFAMASICNAQFPNFDELKVETYSTKSKIGSQSVDVKFLDDIEFQKVQNLVKKKNLKKLGETVISPENPNKEYLCTPSKGNSSNIVCFKVFEVDKEKRTVKMEFRIIDAQGAPDKRLINGFFYHFTKDYNYAITLRADKKSSYTFLVSPNDVANLAEK